MSEHSFAHMFFDTCSFVCFSKSKKCNLWTKGYIHVRLLTDIASSVENCVNDGNVLHWLLSHGQKLLSPLGRPRQEVPGNPVKSYLKNTGAKWINTKNKNIRARKMAQKLWMHTILTEDLSLLPLIHIWRLTTAHTSAPGIQYPLLDCDRTYTHAHTLTAPTFVHTQCDGTWIHAHTLTAPTLMHIPIHRHVHNWKSKKPQRCKVMPAFNTSRWLPHAHHGAHIFTYKHTEQYGIKGMYHHTRLIFCI